MSLKACTYTGMVISNELLCDLSLVPRPSITANAVEGLAKLLRRMTSGGRMVDVGRLEAW